jgi:DNA-binding CsgD family transcriptional regulator
MLGDPRTVPIETIAGDSIPRAWILAGRPLHPQLIESAVDLAPANVVMTGREAERNMDHAAIERALDGSHDLRAHLDEVPEAWLIVSEPQWLDGNSLAEISRVGDGDTPVVVITSQLTPELSGLRDTLAPPHRHFAEPWADDGAIEEWITSRIGRQLGDTALSELIAAAASSAHLLDLLISDAARRDMRMPGAADSVPTAPGDAVVDFVRNAIADLTRATADQVGLAAVTSTPVTAACRVEAFAAGLTDVRGVVARVVAEALIGTLDDAARRDLSERVSVEWSAGALTDEEATAAFLVVGRAPPSGADAIVNAASRWTPVDPVRALAALDLIADSALTNELRMRGLALSGRMTEAAGVADRLLTKGPSPQASLVTAAGLAAAARFRVAAGAYEASDPDDELRIGAPLLGAPVRAAIGQRAAVSPGPSGSLTAAAVSTFAGGASGLVEGREDAIAELRDGAELAANSDATLWPDTPHTLASLALTLDFEHERATQLLAHGLSNQVGGAAHRPRQRLLTGWVAVRAGRWTDAESTVADLSETALGLRDRLALAGLQVALARRSGDITALERQLGPAFELVLRHPIDLVSLPAHGEIAIAVARMGSTERAGGLLDQIEAFVEPLPSRPWKGHAAWTRVVAGLLASNQDWIDTGAASLSAPLEDIAAVVADLQSAPVTAVGQAVGLLEALGQIHEAAIVASAAALGRGDDSGRVLVTTASRLRGLLPGRGREAASGLEALSDRELEVARELIDGRRYKEIGERLYISAKTVEHHVAHIKTKLGASSRSEMISALRQALG